MSEPERERETVHICGCVRETESVRHRVQVAHKYEYACQCV